MYSFTLPEKKRKRVTIDFDPSESKTQQEFAHECDINNIVAHHLKTGIPFPQMSTARYQDVSEVPDFQTAMNYLNDAKDKFMSLPANVRRYYNDNIESFLNALNDPKEQKNLELLGIIEKQEAKPGQEAPPNAPKADAKAQTGVKGAEAPSEGSKGA